jgi:hypothetical protein
MDTCIHLAKNNDHVLILFTFIFVLSLFCNILLRYHLICSKFSSFFL